jgi:putative oxidoreductase
MQAWCSLFWGARGCNLFLTVVLYITVHIICNTRQRQMLLPMRVIAITAQILIGITLLWLGLSSLLHFLAHVPLRCIPRSIATIFLSRYIALLFGLQLFGSILLLVGRWKVLALVLLGPIALNIVFFRLFMGRDSTVFAVVLALLESLVIWTCRRFFRSSAMFEGQIGPL